MALATEFGRELWTLVAETAPWLLVGFVLAGLLKVLVPAERVYRQLGRDDLRSVLLASLYGAPIPLCSCSVIPTATTLRGSGASRGATTSFLISTPETGVDSISVTWALFDPLMTVARPVVAFATALFTGAAVNALVRSGRAGSRPADEERPAGGAAVCGAEAAADAARCAADELAPAADEARAADDACCASEPGPSRWRRARTFAFGTLLDDLAPYFLVGFVLSAALVVALPERALEGVAGWGALLLALVVGTPLYVCATASTPIAAALVAKGLSPGAALVFLLVGPATNATTLLVVARLLGRRILLVYLLGIAATALAAGLALDALYAALGLDLAARVAETLHHGPGWLGHAAGIVLALLLLRSAVRQRLWRRLVPRALRGDAARG